MKIIKTANYKLLASTEEEMKQLKLKWEKEDEANELANRQNANRVTAPINRKTRQQQQGEEIQKSKQWRDPKTNLVEGDNNELV